IYSTAPLAAISDREFAFGKAVTLLVAVVGVAAIHARWKHRRLRPSDGLLGAALAFLLLSFFGPDTMGADGVYIRMRLVFYFYFCAMLWIAAQGMASSVKKTVALAALGISATLFATRIPTYLELDRQVREYVSAD